MVADYFGSLRWQVTADHYGSGLFCVTKVQVTAGHYGGGLLCVTKVAGHCRSLWWRIILGH